MVPFTFKTVSICWNRILRTTVILKLLTINWIIEDEVFIFTNYHLICCISVFLK